MPQSSDPGLDVSPPITPRNRAQYLKDLHTIDRLEVLKCMHYQDQLPKTSAPEVPKNIEKTSSTCSTGARKNVSICSPHMRAGVQGRADARLRTYDPSESDMSREKKAQYSLHQQFILQSARYVCTEVATSRKAKHIFKIMQEAAIRERA